MGHKDIKRIIKKQLKTQYPNWKRLKRKVKKEIVKKVLVEVTADYDFTSEITVPPADLLGIEEQLPAKGIITLDEMATFIKDKELGYIDELLDNRILKRILAYDGYHLGMHDIFPVNMFRAELLKAVKYPEISYRKFCTKEYLEMDRKQNRVFCGLSLSKGTMIHHTQLCISFELH
jgi:hypothetical protein